MWFWSNTACQTMSRKIYNLSDFEIEIGLDVKFLILKICSWSQSELKFLKCVKFLIKKFTIYQFLNWKFNNVSGWK